MKVALLGDAHFGASKHSDIIHNHFEKFYNFFFDYLYKNNIKTLIQEGDLFDIRKLVHFQTIKWVNEKFFQNIKERDINLYVISGNHDCVYKNTNEINSVELLCPSWVTVVDKKPSTINLYGCDIDLFPWINDGNIDETMEFIKNSDSKYAVGHFEFSGFPMHAGTVATTGMNHKMFSKYTKVFSGHYHTISETDNVLYTGTPCELNWSDCNDLKGFWVLDTETGELEHIKNPYTLFEKISYVEGMSYDFTQVCKKYVKIVVVDKTDQKKFDRFVDDVKLNFPHDVKIIEHSVVESVKSSVNLTEMITTQDMLLGVVDNITTTLDKPRLKNYVLEMYTEAMQLTKTL